LCEPRDSMNKNLLVGREVVHGKEANALYLFDIMIILSYVTVPLTGGISDVPYDAHSETFA
jgi:hypothetical protein